MKVGIIDADLIARKKHRFPNLACMKISAYQKKQGHDVELLLNYDAIENYDQVFISKVFTETPVPDGITELPWVQYGGTGFFYDKAPPLPYEVEHIMPDYHLYDDFVKAQLESGVKKSALAYYTDYSIGFVTRGCIRGCSFCVNKNYKACLKHSPVIEFLDPERKYICLLDDNVLACKDWKEIFRDLNATGKRFQFKQGMDERLLTDEKCEVIFSSKWIGDYIFAFDNIKDRKIIERKLRMLRRHTQKQVKFYVFCAYNHDTPGQYPDGFYHDDIRDIFERIHVLMQYQCHPYIMRYEDYEKAPDPYRGMYINLARWCNQPSLVKSMSFREFATKGGNAAEQYMVAFEKLHPDIANLFYDMKWSDFTC